MTTRREFLKSSAVAAGAVAVSSHRGAAKQGSDSDSRFKKALIIGKPTEASLKPLKEAGFDGVETNAIVAPEEAAAAKKIADELGMTIHSVLRGWAEFNNNDPAKVQASLDRTAAALRAAQAYGAATILLVPCRIGGMPMPQPWEFRIRFDPKTGHLRQVVPGDNTPFQKYMEAHDHAYDTSQAAIRKLIPVAKETGVIIAVENVWNNLFVDPRHLAHFIDSFRSPWVREYFDIANHVKYGRPEHWIGVLGKRIAKAHVKDFKLNPNGHGGKFVNIRDGSVNWPVVRRAFDSVGYHGWLTIEGSGGLSLEEKSRRLDLIIAGK